MHCLDTLFKCREIILETNIEVIDGYERTLREWDEYLKYYNEYENQDEYTSTYYEEIETQLGIDYGTSQSFDEEVLYLTDRILMISDDLNYVLLGGKERNEWFHISEFDQLLEKHIIRRLKKVTNVFVGEPIIGTPHTQRRERTLEELLQYFDELESKEKLRRFREEGDDDDSVIIEEPNSEDTVHEIMANLGLINSYT